MNKKLLLLMTIFTILCLTSFFVYGNSHDGFYESFFPNFFSDLFTGVIIVFFLSQYLPMIEKPSVEIIGKHFLDETTNNSHKIAFSIKNTGNTNFKKEIIYWHIYIKNDFVFRGEGTVFSLVTINNEEYKCLSGSFASPIYIKTSNYLIDYDIFCHDCKQLKFLYYLSTGQGLFPKTTNLSEDNQLIISKKTNFCYIDIE